MHVQYVCMVLALSRCLFVGTCGSLFIFAVEIFFQISMQSGEIDSKGPSYQLLDIWKFVFIKYNLL